jgi:hypothetical protein
VSTGPLIDKISDQLNRYQVNFDSGPDGWVLATDLAKVTPAPVPPPVPPPAPLPPPPAPICAPTGSGTCRYADPANLQAIADQANPGDVVVVRSGTYTGGATILDITRSGTAANPIVFKAETRGGAVIDGQNNHSAIGIEVNGSYVRVQGFEVRGTSHYGIEVYRGHDVVIAQNHVHDVGHYCTSTSNGIVGINAYVPNLVIEQNVVHDVGRWAHGQNGCVTSNAYWQNHDHGVYHGQGDNVVIRNNVFYNFTRGWAIQRYDGDGVVARNLQIVNNTFVGANPNKDGQVIVATPVLGLVVSNNIFYQPRTAGVWFEVGGSSGVVSNNLTYGASLTIGSTAGLTFVGNLMGDPKFVDAAGRDFFLQAGSPAIDRGVTLPSVFDDFLGTRRPRGAGVDIGAYEQ